MGEKQMADLVVSGDDVALVVRRLEEISSDHRDGEDPCAARLLADTAVLMFLRRVGLGGVVDAYFGVWSGAR